MRRASWASALLLLSCLLPVVAFGQQVELQMTQGPYYVDVPVEVRVLAQGFADEPTPHVTAPDPAAGTLELLDVSPQVSSSVVITNGRLQQSREVRFVYRYLYLASAPGKVVLGPFTVEQDDVERTTRAYTLAVASVPLSDRLAVELVLPGKRVYVGQTIPVQLRFTLGQALRERLEGYVLRVPFLEMTERFHFQGEGAREGTSLKLQTHGGEVALVGEAVERNSPDGPLLEITVARTVVPLREGEVRIPAASVVADEGTSYRREIFGGRRATQTRKLRAADRERVLEVLPVPRAGRPSSFAGAVGQGFQLDVSADRTVVQVGDPITLTLSLRGDGNLERIGLPPLGQPGLLPTNRFRVPEGELTGEISDGAKHFTAMVRVLDERQQEIPALEYAWFDPVAERYETTRSRPIALSVREATVVGAEDVESDPEPRTPEPAPERTGAPAKTYRSFSQTGADLAIERDVGLLARDARTAPGGGWLVAGIYAVSLLGVGLAVVDRRRVDRGPEKAARRRRLDAALTEIRAAAALPAAEGAERVSGALRRLVAEDPAAHSAALDAILGECDAASYAPESQRSSALFDPQLQHRALAWLENLSGDAG